MNKLLVVLVLLLVLGSAVAIAGEPVNVLSNYFFHSRQDLEEIPNDYTSMEKDGSSAQGAMIRDFPAVGAASFDEAQKPSVSLFNGDLAFSVPLTSVSDVNDLSLGLSLNYNSHIDQLTRPENWDGAQPGWVGAGWSLDVGSINYDVENYKMYITAPGVSGELLGDGFSGDKVVEYDPYTQVFIDGYTPGLEQGEVVLTDGTIYEFDHSRQAPKFERKTTVYSSIAWTQKYNEEWNAYGYDSPYVQHSAFLNSPDFTSEDTQIIDDIDSVPPTQYGVVTSDDNCYLPTYYQGWPMYGPITSSH
nr:hypothetical protein [Nanoarchaeum sp.]